VPVADTLKAVDGNGRIRHTVPRDGLWRAQTPQAFRLDLLERAYRHADRHGVRGTDEAALFEEAGLEVRVVESGETNIKITRPEDLTMAQALLRIRHGREPLAFRVGHGFDAHRFEPGRKLILGGVEIPHTAGLLGHSDADALTHALCDAILGAAGLGDIGRHFPDTDPAYKGADSIGLLRQVMARLRPPGLRLVNADITVVAQRPRLAAHLDAMRETIAAACGVDQQAVNIKATTTEKMGYTGREEGISCHAVALLAAV